MNSSPVSMAIVFVFAWGASVHAQCQYDVQDWPPHQCGGAGGTKSYSGLSVNNLGGWCGYRYKCSGGGWLPVYCPVGSTPQTLPLPAEAGEDGGWANAVNDAGVVVGYFNGGPQGVTQIGCVWWPDGTFSEIPPAPGGAHSRANDINNSNVIIGVSYGAYVLEDGVMTTITPPPGMTGAACWKISDSGFVVGAFISGGDNTYRAFRWREGDLEILEPISGYLASYARGVNNAGHVVGSSSTFVGGSIGYVRVPTIWRGDVPEELPLAPGFTKGGCFAINDAGVITGYMQPRGSSTGGTVYVAWINGQIHVIEDLTAAGAMYYGQPVEVNELGQILTGGAQVLTPADQNSGDVNGDCAVDGSDLLVVLSEWGPREWSTADIDGDGFVSGDDLAVVLGHWTGS